MEENNNNSKSPRFGSYWIYGIIALFLIGLNLFSIAQISEKETTMTQFEEMVLRGDVEKVEVINKADAYVYIKKDKLNDERYKEINKNNSFGTTNPHFTFQIPSVDAFERKIETLNKTLDAQQMSAAKVSTTYKDRHDWFGTIWNLLLPILIIAIIWIIIMRRMGGGAGGPGGQLFNIGKSKAALFDENTKSKITFKDVAGLDEAKEEVMEVVDFLKTPQKYTALGGKIPKGVLLVGPPGTGKTLLAKAVAGEANVPFFSLSGSDFVEMFVGVGASRVRDLFRQAREKAPCIVFIDEIDAIGRARGRGALQGGNDERENTLNQLLVEMDGFSTDKGVILMAATNRSDVLDVALMRPGRFDRQIGIGLPDLIGREQIFKVHLKSIKINEEDVSAAVLAEMTPGFAGADIANICNEAALIAARKDKSEITMEDFNYAMDKVIAGLEKRSNVISPEEKKVIAYHEAGHAISGWFLPHAMPLVKVTIVPRTVGALGYAQYLPKDEYIVRTEQMLDRMCMALAGRAAEDIIFGKISTGAQNDLDQVTAMAYSMISVYGMNDKVGNVSFYRMSQDQFQRPYSDETARLIDDEVRIMIQGQYNRAKEVLTKYRRELELLAQTLLEKEVIVKSDLEKMIGPRPSDAQKNTEDEPIPTEA
jgi:cell division protease FtsH